MQCVCVCVCVCERERERARDTPVGLAPEDHVKPVANDNPSSSALYPTTIVKHHVRSRDVADLCKQHHSAGTRTSGVIAVSSVDVAQ